MMKQFTVVAAVTMVILVAAVIARLVFDPEDEPADGNPPQAFRCDGLRSQEGVVPTPIVHTPDYVRLADAEAAFGFRLPDVHTPGWSFWGANEIDYDALHARNPNPPPPPAEGEFIGASLTYICLDTTTMDLVILPAGQMQSYFRDYDIFTNRVPAPLQSRDAEMIKFPDGLFVVFWEEDGRDYAVTNIIRGTFTEADALAVIDSLA